MQIQVQCPVCKATFEVPHALAGRDGECSRCQKIFKVIPRSGEIATAARDESDSAATMEMPVFDQEPASDTDEFDIPVNSAPLPGKQQPHTPAQITSSSDDTLIPLDDPPGRNSNDSIPAQQNAAAELIAEESPLPEIEDDGSLFGDELPELETVREPVSRYASEDEISADSGTYSLSGSSISPDQPKQQRTTRPPEKKQRSAKKSRSKKASRSESSGRRRPRKPVDDDSSEGGDSFIEDSSHDDSSVSTPVMLRRSGTFSSAGDSESESHSGTATRRSRRASQRTKSTASSSETAESRTSTAGRKSRHRSSNSRPPLALIIGAVVLLVIAGVWSWWSSDASVNSSSSPGGTSVASPISPASADQTVRQNSDSSSGTASASSSPPRRTHSRNGVVDVTSSPPGSTQSPGVQARSRNGDGTRSGTSSSVVQQGRNQSDEVSLFPVDQVPIPEFPQLGTPRASTIAGVLFHEISLSGDRNRSPSDPGVSGSTSIPGSQMDMILYLPSGTHPSRSLPCVMIAAAGTTLLEGNGCFDESYQAETIPYVQQGFAVLGYSLDGPLTSETPSNREVMTAFNQFRAAHAGLVNARNAMEFLLQRVPAVDPTKIFAAGHSSAGTLSLLLAAHENRLAGAVAYAPCIDLETRLADYVSDPRVQLLLPGITDFVRQESPLNHVTSMKSPIFLFHAEGDANSPFEESQRLAAMLSAQGTPCQLEAVPDGDHYESMLAEGIPRAIAWLRKQMAER